MASVNLSRVHKHVQASRLQDLLSNSPLVLIYQCLGTVRANQIEEALRKDVPPDMVASTSGQAASSPAPRYSPVTFRIKNSLAAGAGGGRLADLLQANNLLVGWQPQGSSGLDQRTVRAADTLDAVFGRSAASGLQQPQRLKQQTLAALVAASLRVGAKHPVAPLAGFYCGQPIRISHLKQWSELDETKVYAELLAELEAPSASLALSLDPPAEDLLACIDALAPNDLLACLDARGSAEEASSAALAAQ